MTRLGIALASTLVLVACASAPRPRIMSDMDAASSGAQAKEAEKLAPQAHARAVALQRDAERAYDDGDQGGAQILSEHAIAAYGHAFVLARRVRAEGEMQKAQAELAKAKKALADLDEKQKRVAAEADDLELRVKVAEDALPLVPNAPASPERERARLDASRALASQARLLCTAARLLDAKQAGLADDSKQVADLEQEIDKSPKSAPIDRAVQLRSTCLKHLTQARRPATRAAPGAGVADALLAELSQSGQLHPFRDDRGVVVTLRGLFGAKGALSAEGEKVLTLLGRVAKAHPEFPVLVVTHSKKGSGSNDDPQAKTVTDALTRAGAPHVDASAVGSAQPVVDPARPGAAARNERVEIVFVAPAS